MSFYEFNFNYSPELKNELEQISNDEFDYV